MSRTIPAAAPPSVTDIPAKPGFVKRTYSIKVVTPLLGGGVTARKNDPETLIRVPSIRGHLRQWWRATIPGAANVTAEGLRDAESALWGSTSIASPVEISVAVKKPGHAPAQNELNLQEHDRLFPVFHADVPNIRLGVEFELTLRFPETATAAMENTLWAWTTFGGIGAKTRRGCGALYSKAFGVRLHQGDLYVQHWTGRVGHAPTPATWPRLKLLPLVRLHKPTEAPLPPLRAWRLGIESYRSFRQKGPEGYGLQAFEGLGYAGKMGRMASPMILRPAVWADGAAAAPMVVLLQVDSGRADTGKALSAVARHFQQQGFVPAGEY